VARDCLDRRTCTCTCVNHEDRFAPVLLASGPEDPPAANMKTARPPPAGGSLIIATWTGKYPPGGFV